MMALLLTIVALIIFDFYIDHLCIRRMIRLVSYLRI